MICSAYESLAASKQIAFTFQAPDSELPVKIDPEKIEKVCMNLLSNAFKFTPMGGQVYLSVGCASAERTGSVLRTEDTLSVKVRDTGIGIDAEALPHIFDRFYQPPYPPEGGEKDGSPPPPGEAGRGPVSDYPWSRST